MAAAQQLPVPLPRGFRIISILHTESQRMDLRNQQLTEWSAQKLTELGATVPADFSLAPVSGDASFRRYFRARLGHRHWIAMDAPPEKEDSVPFVAIATAWRRQGIPVPELIATDLEKGFLLLEDFGDDLLLAHLEPHTADAQYATAMDILLNIQQSNAPEQYPLPPYSPGLLQTEMNLFRDWLSAELLTLQVPDSWFNPACELLIRNAQAQPQVPVHRDYHARNLMCTGAGGLGVLDFQDAVEGPITYDLVSLLRDCYLQWPEARVRNWALAYAHRARDTGILQADDATFLRWFNRMGIQRHLKASGIFARLWLRDGKKGYLADIPRTLSHILIAAEQDADMAPLCTWIRGPMRAAMQGHPELANATRKYLP